MANRQLAGSESLTGLVWTGIGAVGAVLVGVVVLGEPLTIARIGGAALIVAGLTLLKLSASA